MTIINLSLYGSGLILICLATTIMISCTNSQSQKRPLSITDINSFTGLNLPINSVITNSIESDAMVDPVTAVRIKVDKSGYPSLIQDIQSKKKDPGTGYSLSAYAGNVSWWKPQNIVIEKLFIPGKNMFVYSVVSEKDDYYIVYLEYGTW